MRDQFVAAGSHLKTNGLPHFSFYRQLQTSWRDLFSQFVWVVVWVVLFCRCYKFYLSIVDRGFTSKNASKENNRIILFFLRFHESEAVNLLKTKPQLMKENLGSRGVGWVVGGGGGVDKNVGRWCWQKMKCPIFIFCRLPDPPFILLRRRCACIIRSIRLHFQVTWKILHACLVFKKGAVIPLSIVRMN